jgi:hypothetical protein
MESKEIFLPRELADKSKLLDRSLWYKRGRYKKQSKTKKPVYTHKKDVIDDILFGNYVQKQAPEKNTYTYNQSKQTGVVRRSHGKKPCGCVYTQKTAFQVESDEKMDVILFGNRTVYINKNKKRIKRITG